MPFMKHYPSPGEEFPTYCSFSEEPLSFMGIKTITGINTLVLERVISGLLGKGIIESFNGEKCTVHDLLRIISRRFSDEKRRHLDRLLGKHYYRSNKPRSLLKTLIYSRRAENAEDIRKTIMKRVLEKQSGVHIIY